MKRGKPTGRGGAGATARGRASLALGRAAERYPDVPIEEPDTRGLSPADARLAQAIVRAAVQRWLTLTHLLETGLRRPVSSLEPTLAGVLLAGAAQVVLLERVPVHAAVDEAVTLGRRLVRPGAAGLVNAGLRRLAEAIAGREPQTPWRPAADAVPGWEGGVVRLAGPMLPPDDDPPRHLAAAAGLPETLGRRWVEHHGPDATIRAAYHAAIRPPLCLAVEPGFEPAPDAPLGRHDQRGFVVWEGAHGAMLGFLAEHPGRRVQDPTAAVAVASTAELKPRRILDYCAGMGTKTRQLAALHPDAEVLATDTDRRRRAALGDSTRDVARVSVVGPGAVGDIARSQGPFDLIVLDVPCSNTGVLGRRPEARHRFDARRLRGLTETQRSIITQALGWAAPGGAVLYSTCSLEPEENTAAVEAVLSACPEAAVGERRLTLPQAGIGPAGYRDGGFFALIGLP